MHANLHNENTRVTCSDRQLTGIQNFQSSDQDSPQLLLGHVRNMLLCCLGNIYSDALPLLVCYLHVLGASHRFPVWLQSSDHGPQTLLFQAPVNVFFGLEQRLRVDRAPQLADDLRVGPMRITDDCSGVGVARRMAHRLAVYCEKKPRSNRPAARASSGVAGFFPPGCRGSCDTFPISAEGVSIFVYMCRCCGHICKCFVYMCRFCGHICRF
jgi:hypothetical protein